MNYYLPHQNCMWPTENPKLANGESHERSQKKLIFILKNISKV